MNNSLRAYPVFARLDRKASSVQRPLTTAQSKLTTTIFIIYICPSGGPTHVIQMNQSTDNEANTVRPPDPSRHSRYGCSLLSLNAKNPERAVPSTTSMNTPSTPHWSVKEYVNFTGHDSSEVEPTSHLHASRTLVCQGLA